MNLKGRAIPKIALPFKVFLDLEVCMRFLKARRAIETLEAAITFPIAILVMLATVNLGMVVYGQQAVQAAARQGARMGSVAQQCSACYAMSAASSAINGDPIVKQAGVAILSPGGVAGSILIVRVSGQIPSRFNIPCDSTMAVAP